MRAWAIPARAFLVAIPPAEPHLSNVLIAISRPSTVEFCGAVPWPREILASLAQTYHKLCLVNNQRSNDDVLDANYHR